jgi:hypothetical protein
MAALAILDSSLKTITIKAHLIFYGTEATEELAAKIMDEIRAMYQSPDTTIELDEQLYQVNFELDYAIKTIDEVMILARGNTNYQYNFIRIGTENKQTRSFMGFGLGDNVGHWLTSDKLGESTTAAHEFGHALGLDHPQNLDFRGQGNPGIMAPRGTIVDAPLQWIPTVAAGEYGGTLNPIHRRVKTEELRDICKNLRFDAEGVALIGKVSNVLFSPTGDPVRFY